MQVNDDNENEIDRLLIKCKKVVCVIRQSNHEL